MGQVTPVSLLVVLSAVLVVPALSDCSREGPADCNFQLSHACGWKGDGGGWYVSYQSTHRYRNYFLSFRGAKRGRVISRLACSTGDTDYCLTFRYRVETDRVTNLNVIINSSETGEKLVWTMSSSQSWANARVPIEMDEDFSVIFEAERHDGQNSSRGYVDVDTVYYRTLLCSTVPSVAKPVKSTTTTTTAETTSTTTTEPTTARTDQGGASGQTMTTTETGRRSTISETTPVTADQETSEWSLYNKAIIIGAVAGVVVAVFLVLVLLLVFRRKQLLSWKKCSGGNTQRGEDTGVASCNSTCNLLLTDQQDATDVEMTATGGAQDSATSPQPSDDYYSVILATDSESAQQSQNQLHTAVNKPRRAGPAVIRSSNDESARESSDQLYAVVNKPRRRHPALTDPTHQDPAPGLSDQLYAAVNKPRRPNPGPAPTVADHTDNSRKETSVSTVNKAPYTCSGPAKDSHQPSATSQDEDGDYNSLDLGVRRRVVERGEGDGEELGNVYSGLNEGGDGDTYSEVTLHRRREVIDDQYSCFQ